MSDGKWKCDYKFGHWTIAWNNEAVLCIDDLLRVVQTQPRLGRGVDGSVEETPEHRKDRGCAMRGEAGTVWREHFLGRYVVVERLAQKMDNIHMIVMGHRLDLLSKTPVTTQRISSEGTIINRTTSLYDEMKLIASPEVGVARFWTYPPSPSEVEQREVHATLDRYSQMDPSAESGAP